MKALKVLGITLLLLVILAITSILLLPKLINPNDYRAEIEQKAKEATGLTVKLDGDISWSVFPWLGLSLADVKVDDVNNKQLASLKEANVSVKLLPLLSKKVETDELTLNGLNLNLVKNREGKGNWEAKPAKPSEAKTETKEANPGKEETTPAQESAPLELAIAKINVTDLQVSYLDEKTGQHIKLGPAKLVSGAISKNQPFTINGTFPLQLSEPKVNATIDLSAKVNMRDNGYRFDNLNLTVQPAKGSEQLKLTGDIQLLNKNIDGQLNIAEFNLKQLLTNLGLPAPETTDPKALTKVAAGLTIRGDEKQVQLQPLNLLLDNFKLDGQLQASGLENPVPALRFQFTGTDLDADRYLPPAASSTESEQKEESKQPQEKAPTAKQTAANQVIIPAETRKALRDLNIAGSINLKSLTIKKLPLQKPVLKISANKGVLKIEKMNAGLFDGSIVSTSTLDVRNTPQVTSKTDLTGVDLAPLGKVYTELEAVKGKLNANVDVRTHFETEPQLMKNLNGEVGFKVNTGALEGVNFNKLVCQAVATIRKKDITKQDWPKQTAFNALEGRFIIKNGVATNNDLTASLNQLNLKGDGSVNLPAQSLDYRLALTITGSSAGDDPACKINEKYADIQWPLRCKGKFGQSGLCSIDAERLASEAAGIAGKEAKKKLENKLEEKLNEKLGKDAGSLLKGFLK